MIFRDIELFGERLGQDLADVFARATLSVVLRAVQVPVGSVEFSAGALLAAFLAALDVFKPEIAFVAGLLTGLRPAPFQLPVSRLRALALDVRDQVRDLPKRRRVKPL